jgi:hypothetical protein
MKKIVILIFILFVCSGCSLLPRLTFSTPGTTPQSIDRSKAKEICRGQAEWDELGNIKSCSSGYYRYDEGYSKVERRLTIVERIKQFINNLVGFSFWGLILLVIFVPGLLGTFLGRFIEGSIGMASKALKAVVSGVQKARKTGKDLNDALDAEEDNDVKKYIKDLKEKENIK